MIARIQSNQFISDSAIFPLDFPFKGAVYPYKKGQAQCTDVRNVELSAMGIRTLLPFVKNACRETTILEFKGCSIAVDVSCLLHKGLFGSMEEFASGKDSKLYISYVKKHIQALLDMGCHVIMVFDGRPLPAKKETNDGRKQKRANNMRAGEFLMSQGKKEEAIAKFQQAVTLTPEIVESTVEFFRSMPYVDIIMAPYESDAQLAFLTKEGFADAVITEDSDLIAFGCEKNGLPGIGLQKAQKFFNKTCQTDLRILLPRIPSYLQDTKLKVSKAFIEDFIRAENTFLYQIVFDPKQRCQRPLNPYPLSQVDVVVLEDDDDSSSSSQKSDVDYQYAGVVSSTTLSIRLALGNTGNGSHITDKFLLPTLIPEWSIWSDTFVSGGRKIARREAEELKKQTSCGAFKLDSPNKKRKHIDDDDVSILIDGIKSPPTKRPVGRPKKLRNEPNITETYEQLMQIYCPEKSKKESAANEENSKNSEKIVADENNDPQIETLVLSQETSSVMSEYSLPSGYITPADSPCPSQDEPKVTTAPLLVKATSLPTTMKKKVLGLGKPALVKSPYFANRASPCSNPFKKVMLSTPPVTTPPAAKVETKQKSLLEDVEEADNTPSNSYLINRFSGFKAPGLRRSVTK